MSEARTKLLEHLSFLYGEEGRAVLPRLEALLETFRTRLPPAGRPQERLSERDAVLITYGDHLRAPGEAPLRTLRRFLVERLKTSVNTVHLLPFFPYSSDDGFSVIDYLRVQPGWGDWDDIAALGQDFRLMFDAVINHVSAESAWFQGFLRNETPYRDYFITERPETDLSRVVRPRTSPLLTPFETAGGTKHVWTTFSADQVDLNYANPEVLLAVLEVLLEYVARGAELLRLDAVTFLWKEPGTSCAHHPKTHRLIQLVRSVMDGVAPQVVLVSETNVPHEENISYFGDGHGEAQMVYNFALPPLVLHSFTAGDASTLSTWAKTLESPSEETCFFNFLASHDGIGLRPVETLLTQRDVAALVERVSAHGGLVSYRANADGSRSPYELNISYFDALSDPRAGEPLGLQVARFASAQAIMLALAGVPGIYVHSLLGSRNHPEGVKATGQNRSINREKLELARLERDLEDPTHLRPRVFHRYRQLLEVRCSEAAFHPQAPQEVLDLGPGVFALKRTSRDGRDTLYCLHSVSADAQRLRLPQPGLRDVFGGQGFTGRELTLEPYGVAWLKA